MTDMVERVARAIDPDAPDERRVDALRQFSLRIDRRFFNDPHLEASTALRMVRAIRESDEAAGYVTVKRVDDAEVVRLVQQLRKSAEYGCRDCLSVAMSSADVDDTADLLERLAAERDAALERTDLLSEEITHLRNEALDPATRVVVPIEPTPNMLDWIVENSEPVGCCSIADAREARESYDTAIKSALATEGEEHESP